MHNMNCQAVVGSSNIDSLAYLLPWQSLLKIFLAYTKGTEKWEAKGIWDVKYKDFNFKKHCISLQWEELL